MNTIKRILCGLFLLSFCANLFGAIGPDSPFTIGLKTNVSAAGWRSGIGAIDAATATNVAAYQAALVSTNATNHANALAVSGTNHANALSANATNEVYRQTALSTNHSDALSVNATNYFNSRTNSLIASLSGLGTNTTFYPSAYNSVPFQVNSWPATVAFMVNSNGNVGIGTPSPFDLLHVNGSIMASNSGANGDLVTRYVNDARRYDVGVFGSSGSGTYDPWQVKDITASTIPFSIAPGCASSTLVLTNGTIVSGTLYLTNATKNITRPLINDPAGAVAMSQDYVWTGAWSANNGYGFGSYALRSNTGAYANGFGYYALYNNTGGYANGFGYAALQYNTGAYANGFGYYALRNNTGAYANGFGSSALQNNTGAYANGFGYAALQYNTGGYANGFGYYALFHNNWPNTISIGHQTATPFTADAATVKTFTDEDVNGTAHTITIGAGHGFGSSGKINLLFTKTAGTEPAGLTTATVYQFTIYSGTVLTFASITNAGSADFEGKLENSVDISGSIAIGFDVNATKANQVILGQAGITETLLRGNVGIGTTSPTSTLSVNGSLGVTGTYIATGTTGDTGITNNVCGSVNFIATGQTLYVTNAHATNGVLAFATVNTDDLTAFACKAVPASPAAGVLMLKLNATATAETRVSFIIVKP